MSRLSLVLAIVLSGCASFTDRPKIVLTTPEQEAQIGADTLTWLDGQYRRVDSPLIQEIGARLNAVSKDFRYVVYWNPDANAYCSPGGVVVCLSGLLDLTQSPAHLATVLAHEVGHGMLRHAEERATYADVVTTVLQKTGNSALLAEILKDLLVLPFDRQQEYEADAYGLVIMARAGYDPRAALEFWSLMPEGGGFLTTHPTNEERKAALASVMDTALREYRP